MGSTGRRLLRGWSSAAYLDRIDHVEMDAVEIDEPGLVLAD
jgi:hypothetical protein